MNPFRIWHTPGSWEIGAGIGCDVNGPFLVLYLGSYSVEVGKPINSKDIDFEPPAITAEQIRDRIREMGEKIEAETCQMPEYTGPPLTDEEAGAMLESLHGPLFPDGPPAGKLIALRRGK